MKTALSLALLLGALSVQAQTNPTLTVVPTPGLTPSPVVVPGTSALTSTIPTPVTTPGAGALTTPGVVPPTPSSGVTNLTTTNLIGLLTNLQSAVTAALPTLTAFNDNFNFISTGVSATGSTTSQVTTNFGVPFGANAAAVTGTAVTNAFGIPPGVTTFPASRDTLRALLVLQNDLQRLLPLLEALNGGTNFPGPEPTFGFTPVPITNLFVAPAPGGIR